MPRRRLERQMTLGYVAGLLLIAILASVSTYVMYRVIDSETTASKIYHMLSAQQNRIQRIALLTVALTENQSAQTITPLKVELRKQTDNLMLDHRELSEDLFLKLGFQWEFDRAGLDAKEDILNYKALDREIRTYAASAKYLGRLEDMPQDKDDLTVKILLDKANSHINSMLSDLHEKYRTNHELKQERYKRIQAISLGIIVLVLLLEGLFLFRPMVRIVKQEHDEIVAAKERADKANRVKTEFLANVSHEIRTPLTAIIGFSDMILMRSGLDTELRSKNSTIKQSAVYLKTLIDDFLDFTKASENRLDIQDQEFEVDSLIHEVVSILSVRTAEKGLYFNVAYETAIPEKVVTDPVRLKQVLFNIIGNAIKFTDKGGIGLKVRYFSDTNFLEILVDDTGHGINPADQERIFSRFVQVDSSMTRKEAGSGIGLSLSKIICEGLGGNLELMQTSDQGSSFLIRTHLKKASTALIDNFEVVRKRRSVEITKETIAGILEGAKILLVEDGKENREIYTYFLTLAGATVTIAQNGKIGVEKARAGSFDIVLMDIQMPEMDGYEAANILIADGTKTPIVALTAHALKSEREKCFKIGFSGYLAKPISIPNLLMSVARWTGNEANAKHCLEGIENNEQDKSDIGTMPLKSKYHNQKIYVPMIADFSKNLPTRVETLKEAVQEKDWGKLAKTAHKVKGAGASYGYPALSERAQVIETAAKHLVDHGGTDDEKKLPDQISDLETISMRIVEGARDLQTNVPNS